MKSESDSVFGPHISKTIDVLRFINLVFSHLNVIEQYDLHIVYDTSNPKQLMKTAMLITTITKIQRETPRKKTCSTLLAILLTNSVLDKQMV